MFTRTTESYKRTIAALAIVLAFSSMVMMPMPAHAALLDDIAGATFAFSVSRYLRAAEVGNPVVRLRENTGSTELDFKLSGSTLVSDDSNEDTVAEWLSAHSATTAFVVSVYDQSGNGRTFTQTEPARQPVLVVSSGLNGLPAIDFSTTGQKLLSPSITISSASGIEVHALVHPTGTISTDRIVFSGFASSLAAVGVGSTGWLWQADQGEVLRTGSAITSDATYQAGWRFTGGSSFIMRENGVEVFNGTNPDTGIDWRTGIHGIGNHAATVNERLWSGLVTELIFYNGLYSSGDIDDIEASMQAHGGIGVVDPPEEPGPRTIKLRGGTRFTGGVRLF